MISSTDRLKLWIFITIFAAFVWFDINALHLPVMAAEKSQIPADGGKYAYLSQANNSLGETAGPGADLIIVADVTQDSASVPENPEAESSTAESSGLNYSEEYMLPKTVYIGVDSIVAPEVLPETAALPLPTGPAKQADGSKDAGSPAISKTTELPGRPTDSATPVAAGISPRGQGSLPDKGEDEQFTPGAAAMSSRRDVLTARQSSASSDAVNGQISQQALEQDAPEIINIENNSSSSDYSRPAPVRNIPEIQPIEEKITAASELAVPTGLPEDLNMDEDHADLANLAGALKDNTNTAAGVPVQPKLDERIEETGKPAVVLNTENALQINKQNEWGWTKLMTAAIEGDLEKTNELLSQGADPDIVGNDGRSPLMAASWNRHHAVVEALLRAGADVNLRNRDGWTALSFAAWNGEIEIVNSLLRVSADKSAETVDGFTALQLAQQKGHREIIALLE